MFYPVAQVIFTLALPALGLVSPSMSRFSDSFKDFFMNPTSYPWSLAIFCIVVIVVVVGTAWLVKQAAEKQLLPCS
jgi:hypothetical protein